MDYGYFYEEFDRQWNSILQKYIEGFSFYCNDKQISFDEALKRIFSSDQFECDINNEDKELCEKCILEIVSFLTASQIPPMPDKLCLLLNMTNYMSRDETCFINLNLNGILNNVFFLTQPTQGGADKLFKLRFLEWFCSSLEHQTGVKWIVNSQYWLNAYHLVLQHENDAEISNLCYDNLTKLLDKIVHIDYKLFQQIAETMTKPLTDTTLKLETHSKMLLSSAQTNALKSTMRCLLGILERLLKIYSKGVVKEFIDRKVGIISDNIARNIEDTELGLILARISILLSFFSLTEVFDGIRVIKQDPLVVSGFFNIVEYYITKGNLTQVLELYHYGIKYSKCISNKLPKYDMKGKLLDIERQILALQLEPVVLVIWSEKVQNYFYTPQNDQSIRMSHMAEFIKGLSLESLRIAYKVKNLLMDLPVEAYAFSLESIIKSKELYSEDSLGGIFESLIYSFEDLINYVKVTKDPPPFTTAHENYICTLFKAVFTFIHDFSPSWGDRVKALDLPQIMFELLCVSDWPKKVIVEAFTLMKVAISKRLSPCMSLLIDNPDSIKDLGPLLYRKCFNSEWEIRNAVLEVICTIANNANISFASFKGILEASSLPNLVSTMALNDENPMVKATAFKCLQEFAMMEDIKYMLRSEHFINKVLDIIMTEKNVYLQRESIVFVQSIYNDENLPADMEHAIYKRLEHQAILNHNPEVRRAAINFWMKVTRKVFTYHGCIDCKFPPVLFSKRIVMMTKKEIRIRIYKILTDLCQNGCLRIFKQLFENLDKDDEVYEMIRAFFKRIYSNVLVKYEITPDTFLITHQAPSHILNQKDVTCSDEIIQEIFAAAPLTMPDDLKNFCSDEDLLSIFDSQILGQSRSSSAQKNKSLTPSEFIAFVYNKMTSGTEETNNEACKNRSLNNNDVYNVIDY